MSNSEPSFGVDFVSTVSSKIDVFMPGMPIPYGRDHHRDVEYTRRELEMAPNRLEYREHLISIEWDQRLPQEDANFKLLREIDEQS